MIVYEYKEFHFVSQQLLNEFGDKGLRVVHREGKRIFFEKDMENFKKKFKYLIKEVVWDKRTETENDRYKQMKKEMRDQGLKGWMVCTINNDDKKCEIIFFKEK